MAESTQPTGGAAPQGAAVPDGAFPIESGVWQVRLRGRVLPTTWNSKGAAEAGIEVERRRQDAIVGDVAGVARRICPTPSGCQTACPFCWAFANRASTRGNAATARADLLLPFLGELAGDELTSIEDAVHDRLCDIVDQKHEAQMAGLEPGEPS